MSDTPTPSEEAIGLAKCVLKAGYKKTDKTFIFVPYMVNDLAELLDQHLRPQGDPSDAEKKLAHDIVSDLIGCACEPSHVRHCVASIQSRLRQHGFTHSAGEAARLTPRDQQVVKFAVEWAMKNQGEQGSSLIMEMKDIMDGLLAHAADDMPTTSPSADTVRHAQAVLRKNNFP